MTSGRAKSAMKDLRHVTTMKIEDIEDYIINSLAVPFPSRLSLLTSFSLCPPSRCFHRLVAALDSILTHSDDCLRPWTMGAVCCRPQVCRLKSRSEQNLCHVGFSSPLILMAKLPFFILFSFAVWERVPSAKSSSLFLPSTSSH